MPTSFDGGWSWPRVWVVIRKEWADAFRNPRVLVLLLMLPVLLIPVPLLGFWAVRHTANADLLREMSPILGSARVHASVKEEAQSALAVQFLTLFLLIPLTVPVTLATHSVVSEKRDRTLEPLLATPLHTGELLLGKALGALIPATGASVVAYGVYSLLARALVLTPAVYGSVVGPLALVAVLLIGPLLSLVGIAIAIVVSSRSVDPRAAEQVTLILVLPVLGLFVAQLFGKVALGLSFLLVVALVLAAIAAVVLAVAVRIFQRGVILTRWG